MKKHDHPSILFLKAIFEECDTNSFINLRFLPSAQNEFIPISQIESIISILDQHKNENCYFGVATRRDGDGTKKGITEIPALWADVDVIKGSSSYDRFKEAYKNFPLKPSIFVETGGGCHPYWLLREPVTFDDIAMVEDLLKRIAASLGGDRAATDASRILRIPGTLNHKYRPARRVTIGHFHPDKQYNLSDFDFLPRLENQSKQEKPSSLPPEWQAEILQGVPKGERNISLTRLAGRYLGKGLLRGEVLPILMDVNSRFNPPLAMKEVETILESVIKTDERNHREGETDAHPVGDPPVLPTLGDIYDMDIRVEWAVDKLIPKQGVTVLPGKGGIGKTWLQLQMGSNVADGVPFVGQLPVLKMPVYYVDFENSLATLHDRAIVLGKSGLRVWHVSNPVPPPRLDSKEWEQYKKLPPGLLIFDTLRASQLLDENSSRDMALVMMRLKELRDMGFTIILIHHTPKADERTYKGSTAIQDLCDHVLSLERVRSIGDDREADEDDWNLPLRLGVRGKTRYEPYSIYLIFNPTKGFEVAPDPDEDSLKTIHFLIVKFKEQNGTAPNQSQIAAAVKDHGINPKRLYRLLRKGEGDYWRIITSSKTRAKLYEPITEVIYPSSPSIYIGENGKMDENHTSRPLEGTLMLPIKNTSFSHSSEGMKNNGKIADFHFSGDAEENESDDETY